MFIVSDVESYCKILSEYFSSMQLIKYIDSVLMEMNIRDIELFALCIRL